MNAILAILGWYWLFGWLLISGRGGDYPTADKPWFAVCFTLVVLGSVVMIAADAQKFFALRIQRGRITDGMFRYVRRPNYTGEMIYSASHCWSGAACRSWSWRGRGAVFHSEHAGQGSEHAPIPRVGALQGGLTLGDSPRPVILTASQPVVAVRRVSRASRNCGCR